jgi:hypothetical protein
MTVNFKENNISLNNPVMALEESNLNFILNHFEEPLFPRTLHTDQKEDSLKSLVKKK